MLSQMDDAQLVALFEARPDLVSPSPPSSMADLATRAQSTLSVQRALAGLDRFALQVLQVTCLPGARSTIEQRRLLRNARGQLPTEEQFRRAVVRLAELGLMSPIPDAVRQQFRHPAGFGPPLSSLLASCTRKELDFVCRTLELPEGESKPQQIKRIATELAQPETVQRLLCDAPVEARELMASLGAKHEPLWRLPTAYPWPPRHGQRRGATLYTSDRGQSGSLGWVDWLIARGLLVVPSFSREAYLPEEIGLALRGGAAFADVAVDPPVVRSHRCQQSSIDQLAAEQAGAAGHTMAAIVAELARKPASTVKSGGLGTRELRRATLAGHTNELTAARVLEIAAASGLLEVSGNPATVVPTVAFDTWLRRPLPEQWVALVEGWLGASVELLPSSLTGADGWPAGVALGRRPPAGPLGAPARHRRSGLMHRLRLLKPGTAADPDSLIDAASWTRPIDWGRNPDAAKVQGLAILETASLLGMVAEGALSTAARMLLDGHTREATVAVSTLLATTSGTFALQADLTAVATRPLEPSVAAEIASMADIESADVATTYRFSEQSLWRAYDSGRTADDVLAFLAERATRGVPQPLSYLVHDSYRRHGRVRVGTIRAYVRSNDPAIIEAVLRVGQRERLGLRQLDAHVLVTDVDTATLLETLRTHGLAPVAEDENGGLLFGRPRGRAIESTRRAIPPWRDPTADPDHDIAAVSPESPALHQIVAELRGSAHA